MLAILERRGSSGADIYLVGRDFYVQKLWQEGDTTRNYDCYKTSEREKTFMREKACSSSQREGELVRNGAVDKQDPIVSYALSSHVV